MARILMGETTGTIENPAAVRQVEQDIKQAVEKMVSEYWDTCNTEFIDTEVIELEPMTDDNVTFNGFRCADDGATFKWLAAVVVQAANGKRYGFGLLGHIEHDNTIWIKNEAFASTFAARTDGLYISPELRNKLTKDTAAYWCTISDLQQKRKPKTK